MSTLVHNSTTSFTDRSTRPQYVLIPSSVRLDHNCAHVLVRPLKTGHVSASPHSSLTLQTSTKYPSMPPSMPLRKNRSKRKKTPLLHPHRLKNRLLSPNPLIKMMPHRKTTVRGPDGRYICYIWYYYMILWEDCPYVYPPDLIVLQTELSLKGLDTNAATRAEHR